jgi:MFS family permease
MKRMQLITALIAVTFMQVLIALPFLVDKLGGGYAVIGWLIGSSSLFYAVGSLLMHRFVLRFGQRRILWLSFPLLAACALLLAFVPNIPLLFVVVAVFSVVLALFWVSMEIVFASQAQEGGLLRSLARYCLGWSSGDVVGAWLGTALVEVDLRLPFLAAGGVVLVCWLLVVWLERSGKLDRAYATPAPATQTLHGGERLLPATRTLFFFVTAILGITLSFVPLVVAKEFAHWSEVSARVISLQPLLQACVFAGLGRWNGWVHRRWPLWLCPLLLVAATGSLLLPFTAGVSAQAGSWCFKVGLSLAGTTLAFSFLMNLLYSFERPETRARNGGIHEGILGLGMFIGPLVAGYGAQVAGRGEGAFWTAAGLAVLGFAGTQLAQGAMFLRSRRSR